MKTMFLLFIICSCDIFLTIEDIYKENYDLNCISMYCFLKIVVNQKRMKKAI